MRLGWSAWAAISMAVASAAMVGCGGTDAPLGGPYGGIATHSPPPSSGQSGGTNSTEGANVKGDAGQSSDQPSDQETVTDMNAGVTAGAQDN